jgi:hypothetical protein
MQLEIAKEDTGAIAALKALAAPTVERFISALAEAPPISDPRKMAAYIAKQVPAIPVSQLIPVLETVYTFYQIRELSGVKPARFFGDLMDGLRKSPELQVTQRALPRLRSLLERLLNIDTLKTIAKAARLLRDSERIYCNAKILSDIRPVFTEDPAARPLGAVLTHTLKIVYHQGNDHVEFHVVLDSADLGALGEVVRRAEVKDNTLRELLKSAELPSLDD